MAKSLKKVAKKVAKKAPKKAVKKAPVKTAKKAAKKVLKKAVRTAPKKAVKKAAKQPVKKVAKKAIKKAAAKKSSRPAAKPVQRSGKKFLIIYHAPSDAMSQTANVTPEQQEAGMALWSAWAERAGSKLIDLGAPLINGKRLTVEGAESPSAKEVAGYSLLQAEDWEELMQLLIGHPHLSGWHPEASIEVHESMVIPGM